MDEATEDNKSATLVDTVVKPPVQPKESKPRAKKPVRWQERLLPLMSGLLIAVTVFFFLVTFLQMSYLHWSIFQGPQVQLETNSSQAVLASTNRFEDLYIARQFEVRAEMERFIIEKRYHQISVQLMSGLWLRYLGFITGMILALVGASFILGKLRVSEQELEGKTTGFSLSLRTTSPGIFLAVLGVILMFTTLIDQDMYNVKDANVYLSNLTLREIPELSNGTELKQLPEFFDAGAESDPIQATPSQPGSSIDAGDPDLQLPSPSTNDP